MQHESSETSPSMPLFLLMSMDTQLTEAVKEFADGHGCGLVHLGSPQPDALMVENHPAITAYDVILLDTDSYDWFDNLRTLQLARRRLGNEIPILTLSRSASSGQIIALCQAGAFCCLRSPLNGPELASVLDQIFSEDS